MKSIRNALFLSATALLFSCGGAGAPPENPKPEPIGNKGSGLDVAIASVTLADDCGTGPTTAPPVSSADFAEPPAGDSSMQEPASSSQSSVAGKRKPSGGPGFAASDISAGARACEQSSIQLRVANAGAEGAKVTLQKVEILDESGNPISEVTPREPSQWVADSYTYQGWNEQVAPSETLQVSYALSSAVLLRGATYTVRVTVLAGDKEQTLEQKTTLEFEASMPPDAVT
jgi:hypothetical protein